MALELTQKDFAAESGHWYDASGRPAYTLIGKNGRERATTLRDARELKLYPSVTTILNMEAKPQLERWKIQQACLACLTLPRKPGETDDAFMSRALEDSREQARKAANRGTYLHGLLESWTRDGALPEKATVDDDAYVRPVITWLSVNFAGWTWHAERSFTDTNHGYGGKLDLHGVSPAGEQQLICDYKFKDFRDAEKPLAYNEHCTQLAAYRAGLAPEARCVNLFISSTVPGLVVPKEWTRNELDEGWEAFECLLRLWRNRKRFI